MAVISFKNVKVVRVGMIMRSLNGVESVITKILDMDKNEYLEYLMPVDNNMIIELDNQQLIWAEIPWIEMDPRVQIMNYNEELEKAILS